MIRIIKIHIWLLINTLVLTALFVWPNLFKTPVWSILLFSSLLLKSKKEIKEEYIKPLPKRFVFITLCIVLLLVVSAFAGLAEISNNYFEEHTAYANISVLLLAMFLFSAYITLMLNKNKT